MLRIGICDDEKEMRFALRYKLERILETRSIDSEIYEFSLGDRLAEWYGKHTGELDLVFLDIEMSGSNGMETAGLLRRDDSSLQIVFVTGHPDYVFDGYSVGALGYLMKPPSGSALDDILSRAMAALHKSTEDVFIVSNSEGSHRLPKSTILYFSSDKRQVICSAQSGRYTFYARLDDVENEVGSGFVRIHQRHLVNASAVERISASELLVGGESLPVSRSYQRDAMVRLTRTLLD